MTGLEIQTLIQEKQHKIEELSDPTVFVLNKDIVVLQDEIASLQAVCTHDFVNHVCQYCGAKERAAIILYKTDVCPQCKVAKTKMEKKHIPFQEEKDVDIMTSRGIQSIPTLEVNGQMITGIKNINDWINAWEDNNG